EPAGQAYLKTAGVDATNYDGGDLSAAEQVLVIGPGAADQLAAHKEIVARFVDDGGHVLAIGLGQQDADAFMPFKITFRKAEHINAVFDAPALRSPLAGVGPADAHNRDPRELPLVSAGATIIA